MGYVPPRLPAGATPEQRVAYRAMLVRVLGYDPALRPARSWWRTILWGITGR